MIELSFDKYRSKFEELFLKHNIEFSENSTGQLIFAVCPFCGKEGKLYMNKSRKGMAWQCFSCNETGNAVTLIAKLNEISNSAAFSWLVKDIVRTDSESLNQLKALLIGFLPKEEGENEDVFNPNFPAEKFDPNIQDFTFSYLDVELAKRFYLYLIKRGITKEMVEFFKIKYNSYRNRIIFPVYHNGKLAGWQGRAIFDDTIPKALTEPLKKYKKSHFLFNYDNVKDKEFITIVEGPIDACKAMHYNPVALFGKTASDIQIDHIMAMKNLKRVFLALDPEERKATSKLYNRLSSLFECRVIEIEQGKDCGDKMPEELRPYFEHANKFDFLKISAGRL